MKKLGQHWFRQWLVAWRHQAIAWPNVDWSSVKSCDIHLRAVSQEIFTTSVLDMSLTVTNFQIAVMSTRDQCMMTSSDDNISLCAGNSPIIGEFPSQRPVTRTFDVFFDLRLNKWLSKQSWDWWFGMPLRSLWCRCNGHCCYIYWLFATQSLMNIISDFKER